MVEAGILSTIVTLLVRLAGEDPLDGQVIYLIMNATQQFDSDGFYHLHSITCKVYLG